MRAMPLVRAIRVAAGVSVVPNGSGSMVVRAVSSQGGMGAGVMSVFRMLVVARSAPDRIPSPGGQHGDLLSDHRSFDCL
jgi:hypothetical protein